MRPLAAALLLLAGSATAAADLARELDKAEQLRAQGQLGAAIIELKNALQDEPDCGPGRRLLGVLYVELGNGAEAEKELLRARRLKVRETGIALPLAEALLLQREYQRLLESVQPVSGMSMRDVADLRALRGEALLALGRQGDAEAAVKSAL
ncbi:MAG TPA: tetratricopeptide repeat protein, partial [Plasticicumulans sp.]|nr:tetratricopeptide repeat protein [Plasticicumulans sp.]